jgi:hypothetical protein
MNGECLVIRTTPMGKKNPQILIKTVYLKIGSNVRIIKWYICEGFNVSCAFGWAHRNLLFSTEL